jgi:hypothetical protein
MLMDLNGDECFSEFLFNMLTFRISPVVPVHDQAKTTNTLW